jgi:hypothetical protein
MRHVLFHYVRNNWATLSSAQQAELRMLSWNTPRPAMDRGNWDRTNRGARITSSGPQAHGTEVVRVPTTHGFEWFRPGRWVQVATPWNGAFGFDHVPPEEERRRLEAMQNATKVLFPPPKTLLRFKGAAEEREEEQRRILRGTYFLNKFANA